MASKSNFGVQLAVVIFTGTKSDSVGIVRQSWIVYDEDQTLCAYPPNKSSDLQKITALLKAKSEIASISWPLLPVEVFKDKLETYDDALRYQKKAENYEDPFSTDPDRMGKGFRDKKPAQKYNGDSDAENNSPERKKMKFHNRKGPPKKPANQAVSQSLLNLQAMEWPKNSSKPKWNDDTHRGSRMRIPSPSSDKPTNSSQKGEGFAMSTQKLAKYESCSQKGKGFASSTQKVLQEIPASKAGTKNINNNLTAPQRPTNNRVPLNQRSNNSHRETSVSKSHAGQKTGSNSARPVSARSPVTTDDGQKFIMQKLTKIEGQLDELSKQQQRTHRKVAYIVLTADTTSTNITDLTTKLSEIVIQEKAAQRDAIARRLPVNSTDELDALEFDLMDSRVSQSLENFLCLKNSKKSLNRSVQNHMAALMTDELALDFSLTGHKKEKTAFNTRKNVCQVIIDVVRLQYTQALDEDITKQISFWLVKAHTRLTARGSGKGGNDGELSGEDGDMEMQDSVSDNENQQEDGNQDYESNHEDGLSDSQGNGDGDDEQTKSDIEGSGDNSEGDYVGGGQNISGCLDGTV